MSEYVLKTQTLPFLFLVFNIEAKDTPSPKDYFLFIYLCFVLCFLFFKISYIICTLSSSSSSSSFHGWAQYKYVDPKYSYLIVYLHSETKDISYTQTIPFLKINLVVVNVRYSFCSQSIHFLFVYFYSDTKVIFRTQLFPSFSLPSFSLSFTLKQKTHPIQ